MTSDLGGMEGQRLGAGTATLRAAVSDTLRRARALLEQREFAEAQLLYQGALTIAPDSIEALHFLGVTYLRSGQARKAEPLIVRSIERGLRQAGSYTNHGAVLVALGRHAEALTMLDQALRLNPKYAPALLVRGNALFALGRHAEARAAYDQALGIAPSVAEAWRSRGKVLRVQNRPADALISFERALKIEPGNDENYSHCGDALRDLGRREDALRSYRLALVIRPKAPDLLSLCGVVLTELGRDAEALVCLDEALAIQPNDIKLLYQSCVALDHLQTYGELLRRCERLLVIDPVHPVAWHARGNALQGLHRHAEAIEAYGKALIYSPGMKDALRNQAAALRMLGRYAEALDNYDRALADGGPDGELLYNRAFVLQQLGRYDKALASYELAAQTPADSAHSRYTRAVALEQLGRQAEALECYHEAWKLDPDHGAARRSEAYCRLLMGDFTQGWVQHESRWEASDAVFRRRHADRPLWLGAEPVAGKTVLLHAEQGFGDTLQFCRYANLVAALGAAVVLEVPEGLKTVLTSLNGISRIVTEGDSQSPFDLQCPLMSLPLAFATDLETVPAAIPYLHADADRRRAWQARLDGAGPGLSGRLRVGLAWSGNPKHKNDENRSMSLATLAPLYGLDATFVSLQPEVRERDSAALAESGILDFRHDLVDFAETAALIDTLDLVISVDTSVVHLAGALGRPQWILLPRVPDWRWMLDREDSPWYPDARLFRQDRPGDWSAVIERITHAFHQYVEEKRPESQP